MSVFRLEKSASNSTARSSSSPSATRSGAAATTSAFVWLRVFGIASSFDEAKGRYAVKLLSDFTFVALKPENLVDWAARGPTRSVTKEEIKAADIPESLLELIKSGVFY